MHLPSVAPAFEATVILIACWGALGRVEGAMTPALRDSVLCLHDMQGEAGVDDGDVVFGPKAHRNKDKRLKRGSEPVLQAVLPCDDEPLSIRAISALFEEQG